MDNSTGCKDCMTNAQPKGNMGANMVNSTNSGSQAYQNYQNVAKSSDMMANQKMGNVLQKGTGGMVKDTDNDNY
jgi:hypothetical protein